MPEMDFLLQTDVRERWAGDLFGIMMYPSDAAKRTELVTVLRAANFRASPKLIPPNAVRILIDAPPADQIIDREVWNQGILAGEILYTVAIIANTKDARGKPIIASVAKAKDILSAEPPRYADGTKIPATNPYTTAAWSRNKGVSHLWAALIVSAQMYPKEWPLDDPIRFLQISEFFRRFGTYYAPSRAQHYQAKRKSIAKTDALIHSRPRDAILTGQSIWEPPDDFALEETSLAVPSLSERGVQTVEDYRQYIRTSTAKRRP